MSINIVAGNKQVLMRGAALLLLAGFAAGCSGGVSRFGGVDDVFTTASTSNQRQIISQNQPYPVDISAAPVESVRTAEVSRSALPSPVSSQTQSAPTPAPTSVSAAAPSVDRTVTGTAAKPAPAQMASLENDPEGWSRAGGTQVTAKNGETVYNLSRRFGVPANVIMKVNGLSEQAGLQAGQKVIIPTYVYSNKAPVSAPDSNPNVADAKSSSGTKYDVPADKVPLPSGAPAGNLGVLPQAPKLAADKSAGQLPATTSNEGGTQSAYKVLEGDTLSRIARKNGIGVAALKAANGLQDGNIRIGQTLRIPAAGASVVAAAAPAAADPVVTGATAQAAKPVVEKVAAYTPPRKAEKVMDEAEEYAAAAPDSTGIDRMRWPVRGRVISGFGKGSGKANDGIDIQVPQGTPVKAAENGVVIYAGDGLKEFGNTVLVRHDNGLVTVYGHASELKVSRGDKVKRGQQIASSGMSGVADTPRLHFEVRKNSAPVDPSTFLE